MKLKQIKLSGFKSFVDTTLVDIYGQLVGIVGPNGCGKSNVIDAVRWVLGESSAKQLRGESMTDVIFNGSIKRKPISRATVELVFDNSQKSLYGLWNNYDEIAIKRLISRQGESSYYINNQQVRRKDIAELFLGTGVGTKGYAVIEQGMISRIIESKPEDMRLFIEEAAGVSKYRERRKETLQRLTDTQENLQRLEDIHSEIIKQLTSLQEQAKVAELYQSLTNELKHAQTLSVAIKIADSSKILNEANQFILHCEEELKVLGYQLEEVNTSLSNEQEAKVAKEQVLQDLMQKFNDYRTSLARVEERYKHYSELLKRFETESVDLAGKEQELEKDILELAEQKKLLNAKIEENQLELGEHEIIREEQQLVVAGKEEKFAEIARIAADRQSEINNLKHELDLCQNTLNHKRQQKSNLLNRLSRLKEETNVLDFDQNYHFIKEEIELVSEEIANCEIQLEAKNSLLEELHNSENEQQKLVAQSQRTLAMHEAKIKTLAQLLQQREQPSDSNILKDIALLPELWQQIEVTKGYEVVLEVALSHLLQAKVINDLSKISNLPESQLALWLQSSDEVEPSPGTLSAMVAVKDQKIKNLYRYLNQYIILDSLASKDSLDPSKTYITLDGHLVTQDYIVYNKSENINHLLQYQQELIDEEKLLQEAQDSVNSSEAELSVLQARIQAARNDLVSLDGKHKRLITKKHELQLEFTKQEQIYVQNQRHQERVVQESALLDQEILHLTSEIEELEIKFEDKNLLREEMLLDNQGIELQKLDSETSLQLARNKLQEFDNRANQLIIDNQLLKQQITSAQSLIEDKKLQQQAARAKLAELTNERQSFNSNEQAQEIVGLQEQIAGVATQMQKVQEEVDTLANKIINLKNKAGSLNNNYQRNLEKINQTKFKQQEQQILLSTYQETLAGLNLAPSELTEHLNQNSLSLAELASKIKDLETKIAGLGLVNLKAIEDLAEANSKEQELVSQLEDLRSAIASLESAIEHIDSETRKLLQETFGKLNEAIVIYFRTLFGGGNAKLALTDKDILVAGVQIFAEPPGKKNSTIHLLSGGEKALAAMSFIFALFSLNPAPFCLLDEVDAPLDDANTQRFCNLVKELSSRTQFVYISHNRLAMEMADQLVGVTMQEKGVSTVVSVSLVEAVKNAEATTEA